MSLLSSLLDSGAGLWFVSVTVLSGLRNKVLGCVCLIAVLELHLLPCPYAPIIVAGLHVYFLHCLDAQSTFQFLCTEQINCQYVSTVQWSFLCQEKSFAGSCRLFLVWSVL